MKSKDPEKEIDKKFMIVKVQDGRVDLSKFIIEIRDSKKVCKLIRSANQQPNERKRSAYSGPKEAIFFECEKQITMKNQRFIDDFLIQKRSNFVFSKFV